MTKPMVRIHNIDTDEIIDREMTDDEFSQHEAAIIEIQEKIDSDTTKASQRQAILDRLSLTAEEAALLLGGAN